MARAPRVTLTSWLVGRLSRLGPPHAGPATVEQDLTATMPDGSVLLADRWYPALTPSAGAGLPTVLLRSPYGRRQGVSLVGRLFAERGYQVIIQSCRGTFGSGGEWEPFRNESADGQATLEWLRAQPWCGEAIATCGPSYLGLTQWSVMADPPGALRAVALDVTASKFRDAVVYPGESFALGTTIDWMYLVAHQEQGFLRSLAGQRRSRAARARAYATLPLREADRAALGRPVAHYQDWLVHERPGDEWWEPIDFSRRLDRVPPATLVGGWYDIFLPSQVADFVALRGAGREARLTVGPWTHANFRGLGYQLRDALDWFDHHLAGRSSGTRRGVRLYVMGSRRWIDVEDWPPPATVQRWHLHSDGRLDREGPESSPPDRYRYDPADPTPAAGGAALDARSAGPKDQKVREERPDVLCYTSGVLRSDVTVVGPVRARVWFRSDAAHTDLFVRLCDVSSKGRSRNISDGLIRLSPGSVDADPDGVLPVDVAMWPTGVTFRSGHRIRLQVSSAAHPLYARNTNSGEPLATAATIKVAQQEVFHDPEHPSALELPVVYL